MSIIYANYLPLPPYLTNMLTIITVGSGGRCGSGTRSETMGVAFHCFFFSVLSFNHQFGSVNMPVTLLCLSIQYLILPDNGRTLLQPAFICLQLVLVADNGQTKWSSLRRSMVK